jgi:hypothetical protein
VSCRLPLKTAAAKARQVASPHSRQLDLSNSLKTYMVFWI